MDKFFDVWFPKIFIGMFALVITVFVVQIVVVMGVMFWAVTTPDAASVVGNEIGDLIRPIANAVKGN